MAKWLKHALDFHTADLGLSPVITLKVTGGVRISRICQNIPRVPEYLSVSLSLSLSVLTAIFPVTVNVYVMVNTILQAYKAWKLVVIVKKINLYLSINFIWNRNVVTH